MRFAFQPCATLPRLGWCAHLRAGHGVARVYHGPWVETHADWFVEGAWTGPFERGEIDNAVFNVGSGGLLRSGRAVFCTPTDMIERLYSLRVGTDLFISNSMAFCMAMADDEPDPCYPFYSGQRQEYLTDGIHRKHKSFSTRRGHRLEWHDHCQIAVSDDLRLMRIEKPVFPRPHTFREYVSMLQGVLAAVLENAASPARRQRQYGGLATVSGGYDSNACAALLAQVGVREAMSFYREAPGDDSGEEIAQRLGMRVHIYGHHDFRTKPDLDEAEFLSWPDAGSDIVLAACEDQLVGKVLVTGRFGDAVFDDHSPGPSDFRVPRSHGIGGSRMLEFRLRVGFFNFNPLYAGALHGAAIHRISASGEMAPWRVAGHYNRPIPRRILEEAGVPRGTFGVRKAASAKYLFTSPADFTPAGRADFETYRRSMPRPGPLRHAWHRTLVLLRAGCELTVTIIKRFWWTGGLVAETLIPVPWRCQEYDDMDFVMHWGQARVRARYGEAVSLRGGATHPGTPIALP